MLFVQLARYNGSVLSNTTIKKYDINVYYVSIL